MTGGHPALVGAACKRFGALLRGRRGFRLSPAEKSLLELERRPEERRDAIRVYLEDYLVDQEFPPLARIVRGLQREPELFEHLVDLARDQRQVEDVFLRKQLRDTGLVYTDHRSGELVVASPLIRQWILNLAKAPCPHPTKVEDQSLRPGVPDLSV